jgi:hypothetical protein
MLVRSRTISKWFDKIRVRFSLSLWGGGGALSRVYMYVHHIADGFMVGPVRWVKKIIIVPDPGKGVCADPVNGGAILGKGGPDPQGGNKERQLSPDRGREKT